MNVAQRGWLFLAILLFLGSFGTSLYSFFSRSPKKWNPSARKIPEANKTFRNEDVVLDGRSFIGCAFENVTFHFKGTAPFDFLNNTVNGYYIAAESPDQLGLIELIRALDAAKPELQFYDPNGNLIK